MFVGTVIQASAVPSRGDTCFDGPMLKLATTSFTSTGLGSVAAESFDMVCIVHFLHRPLFAEARRLLRPGGVVASAIHTVRSTMNPVYMVAIGELRSHFADWEILVDREDRIAEVAARKPITAA